MKVSGLELGSVKLGDLELLDGDEDGFSLEALGSDSGFDLGAAEPIEVTLESFLQDGAVVETVGHNNRELVLPVLCTVSDPVGLGEAERRLFLQLERRNKLTFNYRDYDVPTVHDVVTSRLVPTTDDLTEALHGQVLYTLRLLCSPSARSAELTTVEISSGTAPPESETAVVISEADNLTGWTPRGDDTLVDGDGYVAAVNGPGTGNNVGLSYQLPTPTSMTATPYIYVEWRTEDIASLVGGLQIRLNGTDAYRLSPFVSVAAGNYIRSYFNSADYNSVPAGSSLSNIYMDVRAVLLSSTAGEGQLRINRIVRTDTPPILGSLRQVTANFLVGGACLTEGAIRVRHPQQALNDTLVYTRSAADTMYNPPMRGRLVAPKPSETEDSGSWSGKLSDPTVQHIFSVPAMSLPDGTYDIWVRVRNSATGAQTFTWTAQHHDSDNQPVGPIETGAHLQNMSGTWDVFNIGQVQLPTVLTRSGAGFVRLTFQQVGNNGSGTPTIDELWLFEKRRGALTMVGCGNKRRLWLENASLDRPRDTIYVLDRQDGSVSVGNTADAIYPAGAVKALGVHRLEPGLFSAFIASNAPGVAVSLEYFKRWPLRAAE